MTGSAVRMAERVPVGRWFIPEAVRHYAEFRPAIDKGAALGKTYSSKVLGRMISKGYVGGTEAVGYLLELIKGRGDAQDLFAESIEAFNIKGETYEEKEQNLLKDEKFKKRVGNLLTMARDGGYHSDILRREPRLGGIAAEAGIYKNEDGTPMKEQEGITKATKEARAHIQDWELEVLKNKDVAKAIFNNFDRDRILSIMRNVKRGQEVLQNTINEVFTDWAKQTGCTAEAIEEAALTDEQKSSSSLQEDFRKYMQGPSPVKRGYALAMEDLGRFRKQGWKYPIFKQEEGQTPTSPFEAGGMGPKIILTPGAEFEIEKEKKRAKEEKPDTGEARVRKRKYPDTGEKTA